MEGDSGGEAEEQPTQPQPAAPEPRWPGRPWLWVGAVLVAAAIVGLIIGTTLGGRQEGPLGTQAGGTGRPTIVVGTAVAAPSAVAGVPSPSAMPSTVVAGASVVAGSTEYEVKPGDTLRSIAEQQYGDASEWPRIYQANRDAIGPDPDALVAGTKLTIPPR